MMTLMPDASRLSKILGWGFVLAVWAAGAAWRELRADTTDAVTQATLAMSTVTRLSEAISRLERRDEEQERRQQKIEQEQCMQRWVSYRVLRKVDPNSITMMPEPPAPHECRQ